MGLKRAVLLAAALGINCGSSTGGSPSSGSLDCAWLAGDNCWKSTAAQAQTCLPSPSESGTFSADKSTCTYASGTVVTFTPPPTLPIPNNATWNFTVANGTTSCLTYKEGTGQGMTLTVKGETFTETAAGGGLTMKCPDGSSFSNPNALDLLNCPGGFFGGLPGISWSGTSTSLSTGLVGTGSADGGDQSLPLFTCNAP